MLWLRLYPTRATERLAPNAFETCIFAHCSPLHSLFHSRSALLTLHSSLPPPHPSHLAPRSPGIGVKALEAGLHVLMEKPLTTDVNEARALATAADEAALRGQAFLLNNTANWRDGTRRAVEMVEGGMVGEIKHVNCMFGAPLGWVKRREGREDTVCMVCGVLVVLGVWCVVCVWQWCVWRCSNHEYAR